MLERGVVVSHETVRQWCGKFGQIYANGLRRRRPRPGNKWYLGWWSLTRSAAIGQRVAVLCVRSSTASRSN
jgi:hypothetical protein